jgi:hypothetical protein
MKLNKSFIFMAFAAATLGLAACSTDGYWDEAPESATAGYTFDQSAVTYSTSSSDPISQIPVVLSRSNSNGDYTLPITGKFCDGMGGDNSVIFKDGDRSTTYYVNVGEVAVGVENQTTLYLSKDIVSPAGNDSIVISYTVEYAWIPAGSAQFYSAWSGTIEDDLVGDGVTVNIEKADGGNGLYRLMSPYYYSEQGASGVKLTEGNHINFYVDESNGQLLGFTKSAFSMGEYDDDYGNFYFYYNSKANYCSIQQYDNLYIVYGAIAYDEGGSSLSLGWYETMAFYWNVGYPW